MKLRNKKTGEIISSKELFTDEYINDLFSKDLNYFLSKLNKLQECWEYYEEPKEYWFIDEFGLVQKEIEYYYEENKEAVHDKRIAVGNYFKTREEAEEAVEKLKAWKRLKDTITRIDRASFDDVGTATLFIRYKGKDHKKVSEELDLLFSGEDD